MEADAWARAALASMLSRVAERTAAEWGRCAEELRPLMQEPPRSEHTSRPEPPGPTK